MLTTFYPHHVLVNGSLHQTSLPVLPHHYRHKACQCGRSLYETMSTSGPLAKLPKITITFLQLPFQLSEETGEMIAAAITNLPKSLVPSYPNVSWPHASNPITGFGQWITWRIKWSTHDEISWIILKLQATTEATFLQNPCGWLTFSMLLFYIFINEVSI